VSPVIVRWDVSDRLSPSFYAKSFGGGATLAKVFVARISSSENAGSKWFSLRPTPPGFIYVSVANWSDSYNLYVIAGHSQHGDFNLGRPPQLIFLWSPFHALRADSESRLKAAVVHAGIFFNLSTSLEALRLYPFRSCHHHACAEPTEFPPPRMWVQ